jgi:hypothetical protein
MNAAHNALRLRSEAQLLANLTRIVVEALEVTPEGEAPPQTAAHALALISERAEILKNDIGVAAEEARGGH